MKKMREKEREIEEMGNERKKRRSG